jgi:RNA-directed DNA polymerase
VRRNRGAAGVDRVSVDRFAGQAEHYLEELSEALRTGTYRPQAPLLTRVAERVSDGRVLALEQAGHRLVRYADDFVVLCRSQAEAEAALARVRQWVEANGLRLRPDKTQVGNCLEPGQGFEFLGYRFEGGRRYVRRKSLQALKDRIRQRTRRTRAVALERIVAELNPMLRGWFEYFQHAHSWTFTLLDGFVRRRLRALLRKREKRPGFGRCPNDHRRWPNAFFAGLGLFTLTEAHRLARQSR